jgi:hypothetical protein
MTLRLSRCCKKSLKKRSDSAEIYGAKDEAKGCDARAKRKIDNREATYRTQISDEELTLQLNEAVLKSLELRQ